MTTVGAYEAKTHLPRLLERVENGEVVTITKHGREVARLVPITRRPTDVAVVVAELRQARASVRPDEMTIKEMIEDGRR